MPDSGAVYQPTTVGYTYDSGGDGTGGGGGGGLRHGFWRIMSRHKLSSRKWLEWVLLSVALCFFVAGLTTMLVSLVCADSSSQSRNQEVKSGDHTTMATNVAQQMEDAGSGSVALGAGMMLVGVLLGLIWAWLAFFRRSKSPRNGMAGGSGQYGPVLTEVPSQLKMKQDLPAVPLSDQEEETHTLMQDSASPPSVSVGSSAIANQIQG
ncbi:uncharacterized protein LOC105254609 isoform X2 [Camponotus floridanus]|uniref:uncharacterized protein LOC105254609 isoform X2 n=1 Tax=Camponotus floridanus TaxID=104421 RepID=UPI00059C0901|nr:uncharacterized protein LOC105254609 isoform X2 [Camponotus floridanus]